MIDYQGLNLKLKSRGISKSTLGKDLGLSSRTVAKIAKGERLSKATVLKISGYLGCSPEELCREVSDNPLLQRLREEKTVGLSGGIYHELQVRMTYNSNHMEGSLLTEEQTRLIFETNTVDAGDGIPVDDILETVHHFRAIDHCIDHAEEEVTEAFIKELHYILKHDTRDAALGWFAVGDYKQRPNLIGGKETAKPAEVPLRMRELLKDYTAIGQPTVNDIIAFHAEFERIHPFQDGNGRVGRLIAFKECLKNSIIPFIIEDAKKNFYYRGLRNWEDERGWLTDTCLDGQDTVRRLLHSLGMEL